MSRTIILCLILFGPASALSFGQSAVTYGNNPSHDGSIAVSNFSPTPTKLWSTTVGTNGFSYPLIAQGEVFLTSYDNAGSIMKLYALDAHTGHSNWSAALSSSLSMPDMAAYDGGKVFVLDAELGGANMNAYDAATGSLLWSSPLTGQSLFDSPPTASNGIVSIGGTGIGGTIYALRQTDGAILWTKPVHAGDRSSPAITNDGVYLAGVGPQVYKFDPVTGNQIWHYDSGSSGAGAKTLVFSNGKLYVRGLFAPIFGTNRIAIIDATSGQLLTSFQSGTPSLPAVSGNFGFNENGGSLLAFNATTGAAVWSKTLSGDQFVTAPITINGDVFEGTSAGKIYAFDGVSGTQISVTDVGSPLGRPDEHNNVILTGFQAGDGLLVVPVGNGIVNAYSIIVPEPTTFELAVVGFIVLLFFRSRMLRWRFRCQPAPWIPLM